MLNKFIMYSALILDSQPSVESTIEAMHAYNSDNFFLEISKIIVQGF
ncbi:hypothetical protein PRVXH_001523 [Proteinivorax hydrogeniformans]|uniref:Uncharacterized protein n=1 Tax=Proteinivorax hydrogeniformans TaxID=1826727 RepID=A0AAU8HPU7_9FIRM